MPVEVSVPIRCTEIGSVGKGGSIEDFAYSPAFKLHELFRSPVSPCLQRCKGTITTLAENVPFTVLAQLH